MSTLAPIDWNAWRASYDSATFAEQQAFYDRVYCEFPEQDRASVLVLGKLLEYIDAPVTVLELGGWTGALAAETLARHPAIVWWTNYEISRAAASESVCGDERYSAVALEEWYWAQEHEGDLFVASHVLEHLSVLDVLATFAATRTRYMYLQAPLREEPTDWHGYHGSHILQVGWAALREALAEHGYREIVDLRCPNVRCFER